MKKFLLYTFALSAFLLGACAGRPNVSAPSRTPAPTETAPAQVAQVAKTSAPHAPFMPPANPEATANPPLVETTLGKPFTLRVRQGVLVTDTPDKFGITFWSVPQDSRCPKTVQCVTAGDISVDILFQANGLMHPPIFTLVSPTAPEQVIEDYLVMLLDVQPARETVEPIPQEDFMATFVITRIETSAKTTPTAVSQNPTTVPQIPTPTMAKLDEPFSLNAHRTVNLPDADMKITFNTVLEDSRCPKNVNCAQAGHVLIVLTVAQADRLAFFTMSNVPPDARQRVYFRGYEIALHQVTPYPQNLGEKIALKDYVAQLVVSKTAPPTDVRKNQSIVLKPGTSASLQDEAVTLTFERVTQDSRCPHPAACAVQGSGVLDMKLRADGETEQFILDTDKQRGQTFQNYAVELLSLAPYPQVAQDIAPDEYEATFVIRKFASPPQPTPTPSAGNPNACLAITAEDARNILNVPVQPVPASDVRITVVVMDNFSLPGVQGVCGFLSAEKSAVPPAAQSEARIVLPHDAAYAVTAQRLNANRHAELLRVFEILRAADPNPNNTSSYVLQTQLAAGDDAGVLKTLELLAQGTDKIHVEHVNGLGDPALRVWRAGQYNNYLAYIIHTGRDFILAEILAPQEMTRAALQESFTSRLPNLARE